jgi:hypothetical protein
VEDLARAVKEGGEERLEVEVRERRIRECLKLEQVVALLEVPGHTPPRTVPTFAIA